MTPSERAEAFAAGQQRLQPHMTARERAGMQHGYDAGFSAGAAGGDPAPIIRAARDRERQRIQAILTSREAKGRDALSQHLAFGTDSTPDQARALLAAASQERAGLLSREHDRLLVAALKGAGLQPESALTLAMRAEGPTGLRSEPGPGGARGVGELNVLEIHAQRRRDEKEGRQR